VRLLAPAKLNLCLYVGERRADGLHEIRSLFCPLTLADRITLTEAEHDELACPGVEGPNLAAAALDGLRARGWAGPGLRVEIEKRIPVAAGLGGGSADAAAVLRLAGVEVDGIRELAGELGADVPSQLDPRFALIEGAGEVVEPLAEPADFGVVLVPSGEGLSSAEVYAEHDRLGIGRGSGELAEIAGRLRDAASRGASPIDYADLLVNDLAPAARSLRPEIDSALAALAEVGAAATLVTGSGPTAFGIFEDIVAADRAAAELGPRYAGAIVAGPGAGR
jgi:4-diphosphocytidyl-2-C-methyl-D-erythritol kinase